MLSPMGIYRHVRDKDELLDRVVGKVVASLGEAGFEGTWQERLLDLFRETRRILLDHPGAALISVTRPTPVAGVARFYERVLAALHDGGFRGDGAVYAFDTLLMFTFGSVLWEIPRSVTERERLIRVAVEDPEKVPHLLQEALRLGRRDPTAYFEFGLETILAGLEARRKRRPRSPRPS